MKWLLAWISNSLLLGATYYVSPGGADANSGGIDRPLATLSKAVSVAGPGDAIILRDGVYGAEGHTEGFPVLITKSGTPTAWITIKAENKGGAVLDCQNGSGAVRTGCDGYIYFGTGAAYWALDGLVFQHGFSYGSISNSTPAAHDILVRGCRFEYIGRHSSDSRYGIVGFYANEGSYNFTFDSNVFHDIGRTDGSFIGNDHGLYLHSTANTIINNIFYGPISGWGIQTASGFSGLIANNTFAFPMQNPYGHLMLWENNSTVTVRNNIFYNPGGGIAINSNQLSVSGGCSIDHNVVSGGVIGDISGCASSGNTTGAVIFASSSAPYDFHLSAGSAGIGAGIAVPVVRTDFDGAPRPQTGVTDAGAYQYAPGYVPGATASPLLNRQAPLRSTKPSGK